MIHESSIFDQYPGNNSSHNCDRGSGHQPLAVIGPDPDLSGYSKLEWLAKIIRGFDEM